MIHYSRNSLIGREWRCLARIMGNVVVFFYTRNSAIKRHLKTKAYTNNQVAQRSYSESNQFPHGEK